MGNWRGYQTVKVHGPNGTAQSQREFRYFRGMHGDRLSSGARTASVADSDGGTWPDHNWLAGQLRRASETEHRTGGNITKTLTCPGATSARPHAVSTVTTSAPGQTRTDTYGDLTSTSPGP